MAKKPDRMAAIKKAASKPSPAPAGPFTPGMNSNLAAQSGARTGWNPNPGTAPVTTYTPEPAVKTRPSLKAPASRWSPPMGSSGTGVAPAPSRRPPAAADALLDRAVAKRAAKAQPALPSGAVTGPKLRQGLEAPKSRFSPPMDVATSVPKPLSVSTPRAGKPKAPAAGPKLKSTAAPASRVSPPMSVKTSVPQPLSVSSNRPGNPPPPPAPPAAKPRLKPGVMPKSRVSPPMAVRAAPKARKVGGGWRGALVSGGINAAQAVASGSDKKKKRED